MNKGIIFLLLSSMFLIGCQSTENIPIKPAARKESALLHVEMGIGYLEKNQIERAKQKLMHAKNLAPDLAEVHSALGYYFEHVGEASEAEKAYKLSLKQSQRKGQYMNNYASYLCRQKRFIEADKFFQLAVKDRNYLHVGKVYENAAVCAMEANEPLKAKSYFHKALKRNPSSLKAQQALAKLTQTLKEP